MTNNQVQIWNQMQHANGELKKALLETTRWQAEAVRWHAESERLHQMLLNSEHAESAVEPPNLNAELFLGVTNVYFEEEGERIKLGIERKSGRRLNVGITNTISDFFNRYLGEGYTAERETDGSVYVWKNGEAICAIRFITDMGFIRGDKWYEIANELVSKVKFGLKKHQMFFIVSSLRNGLSLGQVEEYLGRKVVSSWQFMNDRDAVSEYVAKVQTNTTCLADPEKQLVFLATSLHPNVLADDMYKLPPDLRDEKRNEVRNHPWIHNIETIIDQIKRM